MMSAPSRGGGGWVATQLIFNHQRAEQDQISEWYRPVAEEDNCPDSGELVDF
jgi:hypothetical protein